jgi:hypothetical protein
MLTALAFRAWSRDVRYDDDDDSSVCDSDRYGSFYLFSAFNTRCYSGYRKQNFAGWLGNCACLLFSSPATQHPLPVFFFSLTTSNTIEFAISFRITNADENFVSSFLSWRLFMTSTATQPVANLNSTAHSLCHQASHVTRHASHALLLMRARTMIKEFMGAWKSWWRRGIKIAVWRRGRSLRMKTLFFQLWTMAFAR